MMDTIDAIAKEDLFYGADHSQNANKPDQVRDSLGHLKAVKAAGRPVFVDYTAAWCVTCQVNKKTTLNNPEVLAALAQKNVLLLRADWTRPNAAIAQSIARLGRSGVPVYALHWPGKGVRVLPELLTPAVVLGALIQPDRE